MEGQENVVENFVALSISSIQNVTKIDLNKNDPNNPEITAPNDPFYNLIEKQAKGFEEFGKRMSLDLKNSYKEYLVQQKEIKVKTDLVEIEKVYLKYEEKIVSQAQLIDSLKARIEELETDSIIKDQDHKKLRHEFNDFKKELQSILSVPVAQDNKKGTDKNDENLGIPKSNDQQLNIKSCTDSCRETFEYNEKGNYNCKKSDKEDSFISNYNEDYYSISHQTPLYEDNDSTNHSTTYPQYNEYYYDEEFVEPLYNEDYYDEALAEPSTAYRQYIDTEEPVSTFVHDQHFSTDEQKIPISSENDTYSSRANPLSNNLGKPHQNGTNSRAVRKIHAKVEENFKKLAVQGETIKDHTFSDCLRGYSMNQILNYENSDLFKSLSGSAKKSIKISINDELRDELSGKKKTTQPLDVYVNRKLVPLPASATSYAEFQKTRQYSSLSKVKRKWVQTLVSLEKK